MSGSFNTGFSLRQKKREKDQVALQPHIPSYADYIYGDDTAVSFTASVRSRVVPTWLDIMLEEIGTKEVSGNQDNPRILEYLSTVKLPKDMAKHDEIAWCAALVNWCFIQACIKGTNKANARSYLKWGKALLKPKLGCIVVLKRGNSSWQGHVGLFLDQHSGLVMMVGGNQEDRVGINSYRVGDILGYRWPK